MIFEWIEDHDSKYIDCLTVNAPLCVMALVLYIDAQYIHTHDLWDHQVSGRMAVVLQDPLFEAVFGETSDCTLSVLQLQPISLEICRVVQCEQDVEPKWASSRRGGPQLEAQTP